MGKYDNYSNIKNIKKAQRKLNRLTRCWFQNPSKIERAKEELATAKLFESCQIFKAFHSHTPNEHVMFSDDNKVMWFINHLIRYEDIKSYSIVERVVSKSHTVTKRDGVISRAIVGHAIAGDLGAMVGAMSAESSSETTYYQKRDGFIFQIFTKDGGQYYCELPNFGVFSNKIHPKWVEVGTKIQRIIDSTN